MSQIKDGFELYPDAPADLSTWDESFNLPHERVHTKYRPMIEQRYLSKTMSPRLVSSNVSTGRARYYHRVEPRLPRTIHADGQEMYRMAIDSSYRSNLMQLSSTGTIMYARGSDEYNSAILDMAIIEEFPDLFDEYSLQSEIGLFKEYMKVHGPPNIIEQWKKDGTFESRTKDMDKKAQHDFIETYSSQIDADIGSEFTYQAYFWLSMTLEEQLAVTFYTTHRDQQDINAALVGRFSNLPTHAERVKESCEKLRVANPFAYNAMHVLQRLIERAPEYNCPTKRSFTVYRATPHSEADNDMFISTSIERNVTHKFIDQNVGMPQLIAHDNGEVMKDDRRCCIQTINVMPGSKFFVVPPYLTEFSEYELLFAPGLGRFFKVLNYTNEPYDEGRRSMRTVNKSFKSLDNVLVYEPGATETTDASPDAVEERFVARVPRGLTLSFGSFRKRYRKHKNPLVVLQKYLRALSLV
jgi:hypothetical protein